MQDKIKYQYDIDKTNYNDLKKHACTPARTQARTHTHTHNKSVGKRNYYIGFDLYVLYFTISLNDKIISSDIEASLPWKMKKNLEKEVYVALKI